MEEDRFVEDKREERFYLFGLFLPLLQWLAEAAAAVAAVTRFALTSCCTYFTFFFGF